ncbi:unnamed protein product [Rhodiola kirilowii]
MAYLPLLPLMLIISIYIQPTKSLNAELQRLQHPTGGDGSSISFLVVGDWGRKGAFNQSLVAQQMGKVGEKLDIDFVISTGDNFYDDGLTGEHDSAFEDSFTNIYTAPSLHKQWYSVLGNHDYRGDVEAQLSPLLQKIDTRWLCLKSFTLNTGVADIFFLDTTPFVNSYFTETEHTYDWRGFTSQKAYTTNLLDELNNALGQSVAKWKIVVGHHAIRSISHHGDTAELIDRLLPILKTHSVDFYMNGHDHCLQHISDPDSSIQFFTSGAGSKAWRGDIKGLNRPGVRFFYDGQGFMSVKLTQAHSEIMSYDVFGNILHQWSASKELLHSSI